MGWLFSYTMISFLPADSSIFEDHKTYCETVARQLESLGFHVKGSCSAYGFDLVSSKSQIGFSTTLQLRKVHTTRGGELLVNTSAADQAENTLIIQGYTSLSKLAYGQSAFKRLFTSSPIKKVLRSPHYLTSSHPLEQVFIDELLLFVKTHKVFSLHFKNGTLKLLTDGPTHDVKQLLSDTDQLIHSFGS